MPPFSLSDASGRQTSKNVADGQCDQRGDDGLCFYHVAELGGGLLGLPADLIVEALGLGLAVAGHVTDGFLHASAKLTGGASNAIVHHKPPRYPGGDITRGAVDG